MPDALVLGRELPGEVERAEPRRARVALVVAVEKPHLGRPRRAVGVRLRGLEADEHRIALTREDDRVVPLHPPEVRQVEDVVGRADDERVELLLGHQLAHAAELGVVARPAHAAPSGLCVSETQAPFRGGRTRMVTRALELVFQKHKLTRPSHRCGRGGRSGRRTCTSARPTAGRSAGAPPSLRRRGDPPRRRRRRRRRSRARHRASRRRLAGRGRCRTAPGRESELDAVLVLVAVGLLEAERRAVERARLLDVVDHEDRERLPERGHAGSQTMRSSRVTTRPTPPAG